MFSLVPQLVDMLFSRFSKNQGLCFLNGTLQPQSLTQCFDGAGALGENMNVIKIIMSKSSL